ncbi:amidohydrolase family protein, partial [Ruminococcaceae bacterium OttesenSCG-928-A11]|nr:amidohydrolase family protein [Ruminococcaceae bacterium OttesenSCG-928-A11]
DCLAGGVDTIEHAATIEDDMIPLFLENPKTFRGYVSIVPTLAAAKAIHENEDALTPTPGNRIIIENSRMVAQGSVDALRTALEHGIPVGIGTDASVPFVTPYNTYQELIFFQDYTDLSNADLIDIATKQTAEIINVGKITGTLDEGKSADFMVLSKNPLDNLKNLKRPVAVVSSGVYYDKPAYKEMQGVKN